jgi:CBS-domain-containing membrane protein
MALQKFCQQSVVTISSDKNIRQACQLLRTHNIGRIIAAEEGKLSGILTDWDIALMWGGFGAGELVPGHSTLGRNRRKTARRHNRRGAD